MQWSTLYQKLHFLQTKKQPDSEIMDDIERIALRKPFDLKPFNEELGNCPDELQVEVIALHRFKQDQVRITFRVIEAPRGFRRRGTHTLTFNEYLVSIGPLPQKMFTKGRVPDRELGDWALANKKG